MVSTSQKKTTLHSLLSTNLKKLTITPPSSSSTAATTDDFDFSDVFGPPLTPHRHHHQPPPESSPSTSSPPPPQSSTWDPPVIHNRSHSFVGPSPRYTTTAPPLPFHQLHEYESEEEDPEPNDDVVVDSTRNDTKKTEESSGGSNCDSVVEEGQNGKLGPGDFEIMRVVGRGAFGKVFQVRKKREKEREHNSNSNSNSNSDSNIDGDGIYAMKVMKKESIIKRNHIDYMKAERDILTKVVHPFIVQLRYSFQVSLFITGFCEKKRKQLRKSFSEIHVILTCVKTPVVRRKLIANFSGPS